MLLPAIWNENMQGYAAVLLQVATTTAPGDWAFLAEKLSLLGALSIAVWWINKLRIEEKTASNERIAQLEKELSDERKSKFDLLNGEMRVYINTLTANSRVIDDAAEAMLQIRDIIGKKR